MVLGGYGFWGGVYGFWGQHLWFGGAGVYGFLGGRLWFLGGAFMVLGGGLYGFLGGGGWLVVLVCWREVGFASLPLCGGEFEAEMWVVRPFQKGSLGAVLLRGAGCDVSACWREGMGPINGNQKNQSLVKSEPVEALEEVMYEPLTPPKTLLKMILTGSNKKNYRFSDFSPILGAKRSKNPP